MHLFRSCLLAAAVVGLNGAAHPAAASVCDWRPSALLNQGGAAAVNVAGGAAAATGEALKTAGIYTLVQSGTGLSLLGSAASGAAALIGGTSGAIGTVGAVLLAPATLVVAGVAAMGAGGVEAVCFFTDERVTDYDQVLALMAHFAAHHPEDRFRLVTGIPGRKDDAIGLWNPRTETLDRHMVADLYIVNGTLMERRTGRNRNLGHIAFVPEAAPSGAGDGGRD